MTRGGAADWTIPGKELLLAACRGLPHDDHPVLEAAGELAQLHALRERTPVRQAAKLERRRTQLVRAIDRWMTLVTPVPPAPCARRETVGGVVDRLAQLTTQAYLPLAAAPDAVFYEAWLQVVETADRYEDLVDEMRGAARRAPTA
ncbi:hypothetical protein IU433_30305 [Nocardia puris]|uniref:DUF4254 domain-containing protein n=2 Tax=Nocardia puris TaxID=208602 RepID=A0A366E2Y7_9NOCA|nr:hypothetical protein [Nocardia puris]MBF6369097.1 hypothetical protein [Nocardia puris]MBF6463298.1 hypothetical protein [Nocardia puris]RBO96667.1 hypothetical protein DFR74_101683 [Nocardia puris]